MKVTKLSGDHTGGLGVMWGQIIAGLSCCASLLIVNYMNYSSEEEAGLASENSLIATDCVGGSLHSSLQSQYSVYWGGQVDIIIQHILVSKETEKSLFWILSTWFSLCNVFSLIGWQRIFSARSRSFLFTQIDRQLKEMVSAYRASTKK